MREETYRTYRQSLLFLLFAAWDTLFPDKALTVHQSVNRSTYCRCRDFCPTEEALGALSCTMENYIREKMPFTPKTYKKAEAISLLRESGEAEAAKQLEGTPRSSVTLLNLGKKYYSVYGTLFPHAGYLSDFELVLFDAGFLLRYPHPSTGDRISPFSPGKKILETLSEYRTISRVIGVESVYDLNRQITDGTIQDCINISEIMHEKRLSHIADEIKNRILDCRVLLLSGPSSSGKTTTTNRLMLHLRANGLAPRMISLDDYYLGRSKTPTDETGKPNYEDIEAIDYALFNTHLRALLAGETVSVPRFDFHTGERSPEGRMLSLPSGSVLLVEGIHALNPKLTRGIAENQCFRVYCSALTVLCFDRYNPISPTDTRLLRRMIRDSKFRNTDAAGTLSMWPSVQKGEIKNIFPYEETADEIFNSALTYEFSVYRSHAEPLLKKAAEVEEHRETAQRLLEFISHFEPISAAQVPGTSILREFIGGSTIR